MSKQASMKPKRYWIKERFNPQLGTYFVGEGRMSDTAAKRHERTLYGENTMHPFDTKEEYYAELERLKTLGNNIDPYIKP